MARETGAARDRTGWTEIGAWDFPWAGTGGGSAAPEIAGGFRGRERREVQSDEVEEEVVDEDDVELDVELDDAVLDSLLPFDEPPLSDEPDDESDLVEAELGDVDPLRESLR